MSWSLIIPCAPAALLLRHQIETLHRHLSDRSRFSADRSLCQSIKVEIRNLADSVSAVSRFARTIICRFCFPDFGLSWDSVLSWPECRIPRVAMEVASEQTTKLCSHWYWMTPFRACFRFFCHCASFWAFDYLFLSSILFSHGGRCFWLLRSWLSCQKIQSF